MPTNHQIPQKVQEAVHTACSEIPDAHPDDIADCVYGMIGSELFAAHTSAITFLIAKYV